MVHLVIQAIVLACKAPGLLIGFFHQRHIAARRFRQELLYAGIAPGQVDELTASYKSMIVPEWNGWVKQGIKGLARK